MKYLTYMYKYDEDGVNETLLYGLSDTLGDAMYEADHWHELGLGDKVPDETMVAKNYVSSGVGDGYWQLTQVLEVPDTDAMLLCAWQDASAYDEPQVTVFGFDDVDSARKAMRELYDIRMNPPKGTYHTFDEDHSELVGDCAHLGIETWDYQLDMVVLHEGNRHGIDVPAIISL